MPDCYAAKAGIIRRATVDDLDIVTDLEARCFLPAEAASRERFAERLAVFARHFWIYEIEGKPIGFINGMVVNEKTIEDRLYADAHLHREDGRYQSIFGLAVLPEYQRNGYAAELMQVLIAEAKLEGRAGLILDCKDFRIPYYSKFGYRLLGQSVSEHGGAVWYDMILELEPHE